MIKQPPYLKKGDKIAIVCPAKKLPKSIDAALEVFKQWGLEVIIGKTVSAGYHQFAGSDELRAEDLQTFLDNPDIKAIVAARGGYGTIRIIDSLDFTLFNKHPKWIVGYSDITVLLSHLLAHEQTQSIHGQMPYSFADASPESLVSLRQALFGESIEYGFESIFPNRSGQAEGVLIGGNLTLLIAVQGSVSEIDYTDKILFIEDVGEHEYAIDRMMRLLKRAGKLAKLKGLIVGAFSESGTEAIPFGASTEEVIWEVVKEYDYPVCFNAPVGHIEDNRAMALGKVVKMSVQKEKVNLTFE